MLITLPTILDPETPPIRQRHFNSGIIAWEFTYPTTQWAALLKLKSGGYAHISNWHKKDISSNAKRIVFHKRILRTSLKTKQIFLLRRVPEYFHIQLLETRVFGAK